MFLLSLIVFSMPSLVSSEAGLMVSGRSSGKNFLIRDSIMGNERIWSHVGL